MYFLFHHMPKYVFKCSTMGFYRLSKGTTIEPHFGKYAFGGTTISHAHKQMGRNNSHCILQRKEATLNPFVLVISLSFNYYTVAFKRATVRQRGAQA